MAEGEWLLRRDDMVSSYIADEQCLKAGRLMMLPEYEPGNEGLIAFLIRSIDLDDFRGTCTGEPYPLLSAVREELKGYKVQGLEAAASIAYGSNGINGQLVAAEEILIDCSRHERT